MLSSLTRFAGRSAVVAVAFFSFASSAVLAQNTEHDWQKSYSLNGSPSLTIETSDSGLEIRPCGDCKEIRIQVQTGGRTLNDYILEEHQDQDHVYFSLKEKPRVFHISWKPERGARVTVEAPAKLGLDARVADGNLSARGLSGDLQVHAGDGSVELEDTQGSLRLTASDGNITIHNGRGTLDAHASDGHMKIDGEFTAVQLHTSDGTLDFALAPGSQLAAASRIESSDGNVSIRVPQNLAADVDVSSSDGRIDCSLPLTMDHYNSDSGHHLHGHLNSGGVPLSIHTSDGNVNIAAL
jgi:hypothetical protein